MDHTTVNCIHFSVRFISQVTWMSRMEGMIPKKGGGVVLHVCIKSHRSGQARKSVETRQR